MGLLIGLIIAGAFVGLVAYFNGDASIRRELRKAKLYKIGDLPEGQPGRIAGRAQPVSETLVGPLTGRPCVYYIAKVEQHVQSGKTAHWRTIVTEFRGVSFMLDDGSGRAIVDPGAARISLDFDSKSTSGTFDDPTPTERAFLERHHQTGQGWLFNKHLRYREAVIEVGEQVAVLGSGVREPDPDAPPAEAYRGEQPTRVHLAGTQQHPLVISDSPDTLR